MTCKARISVKINGCQFEIDRGLHKGRELKDLGGIDLQDVLFLQQECDDLVIGNDDKVRLEDGACLHSSPPADYGGRSAPNPEYVDQPGGWRFAIFEDYGLPEAYTPSRTRLLIKLPPLFPDAQPDMFWVQPPLALVGGGAPKSTTMEPLLGEQWQRFSWHLKPGAWIPGVSSLRDFLRCIRVRLGRED